MMKAKQSLTSIAFGVLLMLFPAVAVAGRAGLYLSHGNSRIHISDIEVGRLYDSQRKANVFTMCMATEASMRATASLTRTIIDKELSLLLGCNPRKTLWKGVVRSMVHGGCVPLENLSQDEEDNLKKALRSGEGPDCETKE